MIKSKQIINTITNKKPYLYLKWKPGPIQLKHQHYYPDTIKVTIGSIEARGLLIIFTVHFQIALCFTITSH